MVKRRKLTEISGEMEKIINDYRTKLSKATGKKISYPTASRVAARVHNRYVNQQEPTIKINMIKRKKRKSLYDDSGLNI